jgi:hypothetical protein
MVTQQVTAKTLPAPCSDGVVGVAHREPQPRYLDYGHPASTSEVRTQLIVKDSESDWTTLQIYRCFIIWGSKWRVVFLPCILLASSIGA